MALKDRPLKLGWYTVTVWQAKVTMNGRQLTLQVNELGNPKRFAAVALETRVDVKTVDEVLDDHAHVSLGEHKSIARAKKIAEAYATGWLKRRIAESAPGPHEEPCRCPAIEAEAR